MREKIAALVKQVRMNRFDRIISVTGYNEDGRALLW